jgi:hypothetical protein
MHYQHVVPGAVPTGFAIDVWKCSIKVFFGVFGFWFGFFGLGYQLFSLARHTLVKTTLGTAHIQIHAVSEARALAGWIPYSQSPQLVSSKPRASMTVRHPKRHAVIVYSFEEPPLLDFRHKPLSPKHRGCPEIILPIWLVVGTIQKLLIMRACIKRSSH